ncbi:trypsin-like cysteine/serine peptidase domain-containing protein [Annulohypoxylon nitens]|nr:trypsin-like cysteine/serine peptidase domain-containing protein [Annulohypoxylon nitens]
MDHNPISSIHLEPWRPQTVHVDETLTWPQSTQLMIDGHRPQVVVFQEPPPAHLDESPWGNDRQISEEHTIHDGGLNSGVVMVTAVFKDHLDQWGWTYGTGFIIDDHHVLTAGHNIWRNNTYRLARYIYIHRDCRSLSHDYHVDAGVVHFNWANGFSRENDQALLHVSTPFSKGIKRIEYRQTSTLNTDGKVVTSGYPYDFPENRKGMWPAHLSHTESRARYTVGDSFLRHWGHTENGNSGGPVVDSSSGEAIAVHTGVDCLSGLATAINRNGNDVEKCINSISMSARLGPAGDLKVGKGVAFKYCGWSVACFT